MAKGGRSRGVRVTRNPELVPGVRRFGSVRAAQRKATYKFTKKGLGKSQPHVTPKRADKTEGRFYASDDTKVPLRSNKGKGVVAKLRKSIRPGTVVIILAGRFRGKRVIVLKQLKTSGLLLVTGQYCTHQERKRRGREQRK
jgi:large subunit ribosomal protein L6e